MAASQLPLAAVGRPAPFSLVATGFAAGLLGWLAATAVLVVAAPDLAIGRYTVDLPVLALHLAALVFLPYAVATAAWHVLPVMLRNDLAGTRRLWLAFGLLAGGIPLAVGIAADADSLAWPGAALVTAGLAIVLAELAGLVRRAPQGRMLVASRVGVSLSGFHAAAALVLGAAVLGAQGPQVLGVPYPRLMLVHLLLGALGWLTLLILAVGRTLAPMLALAPAAPPRRLPALELAFTGALWLLLAGIAAGVRPLVAVGAALVLLTLGRFGLQLAGVVRRRRLDAMEAPLAHFLVGAACLVQAVAVAFAALVGAVPDARAAAVAAILLVAGWGAGVTLGHAGKLLSLSAWSTWPPGPRPKQRALYPRLPWTIEAGLFGVGIELVAVGTLIEAAPPLRVGAGLLLAGAVLACVGALLTLRHARAGRDDQRRSTASAAR